MTQYVFHLKDIPDDEIIHYHIKKKTDFYNVIGKFKNYDYSKPRIKTLSKNVVDKLWISAQEAFDKYGWYGFFKGNIIEDAEDRAKNYGGLSLAYNPDHWQADNLPVNAQTLGEKRYNLGTLFADDLGKRVWDDLVHANHRMDFYEIIGKKTLIDGLRFLLDKGHISKDEHYRLEYNHRNHKSKSIASKQSGRNTYSDTFAYSKRTPASMHGYLGSFIDSSPFSIVRSRMVTLKYPGHVHWHDDENIFLNTRINIPIHADIKCRLHITNEENYYHNDPGYMYCWNTELPHKVSISEGTGSRTAIVLGLSPWFNFDDKEQCWYSNEYFGKVHPFELFEEGIFLNESSYSVN
jgi:hypothetical protein|tara:strand:+ start:9390 stop:10439 length:1050 start_codon:yes stop_codon:yes gene_type:complete